MSRDQKIGLALGILLVGAVAAFFYRHEQPGDLTLPELKTAAELDRQISERPRAPYLEPRLPQPPTPEPTITHDPFDQSTPAGLVPEPIALQPLPAAGTQLASSSQRLGSATAPNDRTLTPDATTARKHTVQRGDTLSSIASQYLGSANRFDEIYEANRERLRDANDLRIGQELIIPPRTPGITPAPATTSGSTAPATSLSPAAGAAVAPSTGATPAPVLEQDQRLKFVPYPGRAGVPARTATPEDATKTGGRRLSQLPPDDVIMRR